MQSVRAYEAGVAFRFVSLPVLRGGEKKSPQSCPGIALDSFHRPAKFPTWLVVLVVLSCAVPALQPFHVGEPLALKKGVIQ